MSILTTYKELKEFDKNKPQWVKVIQYGIFALTTYLVYVNYTEQGLIMNVGWIPFIALAVINRMVFDVRKSIKRSKNYEFNKH